MQRADRVRLAEPEGEELPALVLAAVVVGLVGDDDDVVAAAPQPVGDRLVVVGHPDRGVDDEQHDVGVAHGRLDLAADLHLEVAAARHPPAGVDDPERHAEPLGLERLAVAGDAGPVLDDRRLLADDPVEQRALADVGPADDGDDGGHASVTSLMRSRAPARRAWPSVATTSTGRGRSSTRAAVEEPAVVGQAHVGQQVAVPGRLGGEHAGQVGARHQPGDAGVAAEELVARPG